MSMPDHSSWRRSRSLKLVGGADPAEARLVRRDAGLLRESRSSIGKGRAAGNRNNLHLKAMPPTWAVSSCMS